MIELREVTKRFRDITALDNISLKVKKGEVFTVMGPNGSGKTTLLRIMAGIDLPTTGEVLLEGKKFDDDFLGEVRRNCTMVFQKTTVFNTTVQRNVAYGLELRRYPKQEIEEKVNRALEIVKLQGYEDRWAKKLSGGEQQRVAIARALASKPSIILADEPTGDLDSNTSDEILDLMCELNLKNHQTFVLVTHDSKVAERANRIIQMKNGIII